MGQRQREQVQRGCAVGTMVLLAWLCRVLPLEGLPSGLQEACGILRSLLYLSLFAGWGISLYNRTVHPQVRRLLLNVDLLMLFWIIVRTLRFQLNTPPGMDRMLGYLYYAPMLGIPVLCVQLVLTVDRSERYRLSAWARMLWLPSAVLLELVLTNDLHQQVFRLQQPWNEKYQYGWLFGLVVGQEPVGKVYIRVGDNVDYNAIARMASGASGAELANMINEAALRAVRDGRKFVTQADLEESVEVVIAGYQKKNKIMTDKEKLIVSYHEVGHALVAALQSHSAPVTKITIIPRTSGALGYTMQVDEDEHNLMSREELENKIATLTGGRVAEDLVFHSITTGASNDIEQATKVARSMITRFGMNEEFGMVAFETVTNQYLGGDTSLACSESTAAQIDEKVVAAVRKQYDKAEQLLKDNMPKLHELAKYLYEKETITGDEFMEILNLSPDQLTTTRMETN